MEFVFTANGDFKTEFKTYVDLLFEKAGTLTRKQRIALAGKLTDTYVTVTGQVPAGGQLDRLGSLILHEELTSKKSNKAKTTQYNFHSDRQLETREREEADFGLAQNYGTDGKKHGKGTRNRAINELD